MMYLFLAAAALALAGAATLKKTVLTPQRGSMTEVRNGLEWLMPHYRDMVLAALRERTATTSDALLGGQQVPSPPNGRTVVVVRDARYGGDEQMNAAQWVELAVRQGYAVIMSTDCDRLMGDPGQGDECNWFAAVRVDETAHWASPNGRRWVVLVAPAMQAGVTA